MIDKAVAVVSAHAKWIAAGCPVRSDDEIAARFAICSACEQFRRPSLCAHCGCQLRPSGVVANKIALATEVCPLGKWQ